MAEVYLFNTLDAVATGLIGPITEQLNGYFGQLNRAGGPVTRCWWWPWDPANPVASATAAPTPSELDILVYFLPFAKSVVRNLDRGAPPPLAGHDGLTVGIGGRGGPSAAEVYVKTSDPDILAKLTFHEIMHMKLRMGNEMHRLRGLASRVVTDKTTLTPDNIRRMAQALRSNRVPQWIEGFRIMARVRTARAAGDPLADSELIPW